MWLSEQFSALPDAPPSGLSELTSGGTLAAATAGGQTEQLLPLIVPGGYAWCPAAGDQVMVLREGAACILGVPQGPEALSPGEVLLHAGAASIRLHPDGSIELQGRVRVNGVQIGGGGDG